MAVRQRFAKNRGGRCTLVGSVGTVAQVRTPLYPPSVAFGPFNSQPFRSRSSWPAGNALSARSFNDAVGSADARA
jgi:hypothetical protein